MAVVSILAIIGIAYVFALNGPRLVVAVILGFFPVAMFVSLIARRLIPPSLIICDESQTTDS
jgi:predicted permease